MGRNKPRSKAVDVTKSLLQPTSVTDHIAVQIAPNFVLQLSEEDLSPTQGSEAAFALRREGKLDMTMKLCLNWRQGSCHNHASCTFAHVLRYFGVTGDLLPPATTGRTSVFGTSTGGGTYSSVAAGNSTARGSLTGATTGLGANTLWSLKLAPPSYSSVANRVTSAREDERKTAPPADTTATTTATTTEATAAATTEAKTASKPLPQAVAPAAATEPALDDAPPPRPAAATSAQHAEVANGNAAAPPTPASTTATAPATASARGPPAVLSVEGLRSIVASLSAPVGAAAAGVDETAEPQRVAQWPREFLSKLEAAATHTPAAAWQQYPVNTQEDILEVLGKQVLGKGFFSSKHPVDLYGELYEQMSPMIDLLSRKHLQPHREAAQSPGVEFSVPPPAPVVAPERLFSTAPTVMPPTSSSIGQLGGTGIPLAGANAGGADEADLPALGVFYEHLMNMFTPEE
ncbi:hypothetical protein ABL78_2134 [Leptomonas seymouri]|uniref:C3H1-type domain-containing protein n=1 Tax=Leptomonas seymouri TaxID=5684 RepID=A0A0N1IM22_LEPSE|nr:hypothetical protein ABL78_2134 [Leptomonas seymouri]|eukprot:KPI88755.1 hypothetical protein ABL78_2134 [Leptomonas seymouri]